MNNYSIEHSSEMLLSELTETYRPLYPLNASWQDTVEYIYKNEPDLMKRLTESLLTDGFFSPIQISMEAGELCVTDGMHRVAIALTHGLITVPVYFLSEANPLEPVEQFLIVVLTFDEEAKLSEDEEDALMAQLQSWAVAPRVWATAESFSSTLNSWEIDLPLAHSLATQVKRRVEDIIEAHNPNLVFAVTVTKQTRAYS